MTTLESRFLAILSEHRGLSMAIAVPDMARRLGVPERQARAIKKDLVDAGYMVGSSCIAGKSGYYQIESEEELRATYRNYSSRCYALQRSMKRIRQNVDGLKSPQLGMF